MDSVCSAWVAQLAQRLKLQEPILEFGRRWRKRQEAQGNQNVYDLKKFFPGQVYIGCDLKKSYGVDEIMDIQDTMLPNGSVGAILCLNTIEHIRDPIRAIEECHRILKPGGFLILQSLFLFHLHGMPHDYWRFTFWTFRDILFAPFETHIEEAVGPHKGAPKWITGVACKGAGTIALEACIGLFQRTWEAMGKPDR